MNFLCNDIKELIKDYCYGDKLYWKHKFDSCCYEINKLCPYHHLGHLIYRDLHEIWRPYFKSKIEVIDDFDDDGKRIFILIEKNFMYKID